MSGELMKIILLLSPNTLLICLTDLPTTFTLHVEVDFPAAFESSHIQEPVSETFASPTDSRQTTVGIGPGSFISEQAAFLPESRIKCSHQALFNLK